MFTHFFIKRPVFASVCSLLIIILGIVGFTRLPVQEYPKIDPPIVTVTTSYPGASPQVVETEVTEILEAQINGIAGIKTLTSSSREGSSSISVQFELNRDLEVAAQEVRSRVARGAGKLPDDVDIPVVEKRSGDDERILWIAFFSQTLSALELSNYADLYIKNSLETVDGVNSVSISGERRYAMRLWLDTMKMAARQITALDVEQALRRQNIEIPSGRIEGKETEYPVRTLGRLQTPQDYEDLIIKRNDNGSQVKIRDIGRAEIGAKDDRVIARFNGNPAVGLGISKLSDANLIEVARGIKAKLAELKKSFPEGISYEIAVDYSEFVELAIEEVWISLLISIGLVVLIIFLFLRNWRATLIPAITIPISLIGAFSVMFFMGFSINTLTLFALTLATGLVVDDTIVVLENIIRYMEEKRLDAFPATYTAVGEVVFAVIATTVVLVAVFVPVAFAGGTSGRLFNEFALTLAASVVFSSIVALTLAPPLSARLLRHETQPQGLMKILSFPLDLFEWVLNKITAIYGWTLRLLMTIKPVVILGFIASLGLTVWLFLQLPQGFLPSEDRGRIFTPITAPEGVSINYTNRAVKTG
jgi:Cation/multidrug efflux pump